LNGGEKTINLRGKRNRLRVDGYDETTNTVYQFHGCFWHGCKKCFRSDIMNNKNQTIMKDLYERTQETTDLLNENGYTVVEIWECDFDNNLEIIKFKKTWNREVIEPLDPRDALYGGRTEPTKLLYICPKNHKIRYIDVCSLYPTVMFYDYYPVGHPIKIYEPKQYNPDWFGFIKCKIVPPRGLYHPVLPCKINTGKSEKLMFTLCNTCPRFRNQNCNHSDDKRAITGTWTTVKLNKAIEKGYKIEKVYEVWHFEEKSNELFKGYVQDFMKIKLETSVDENKMNEEEINKFITETYFQLGIKLDKDKIGLNEGRKAVAKMCLNSLWGKFGQRQNMSKTEYVTSVNRFYQIILNDKIDDINYTLINDEMIQMSYCLKDVFVENDFSTNVFIAAFTTSNARLRLYEKLDELGDRVCYYDTDSIVYIDDGSKSIKTGKCLGDWENELKGDDYGIRWVSPGPKSYEMNTIQGDIKFRFKGFVLNYESGKIINGESMESMIRGLVKELIVEENRITREPKTKDLVNKLIQKKFVFDFDKRVINKLSDDHIDSLPYGY
jgi:hypothetical protein